MNTEKLINHLIIMMNSIHPYIQKYSEKLLLHSILQANYHLFTSRVEKVLPKKIVL